MTRNIRNPMDIPEAFASYYTKLYNLKDDPFTCQPLITDIANVPHGHQGTTRFSLLSPFSVLD